VTVTDTGAGMTPDVAARLFDPFFSTKPDGLGLGLAICRTIVEAHGGRLWATANAGTRGTALRFTLRGVAMKLPPHPVVFVVDDDPAMRDSLRWLIESTGLLVETFADARPFSARIRPEVPGCLVLDIRMPGLSGLDLQTELDRRGIGLPTIVVTGHAEVPMAVRAVKAGRSTSSRNRSAISCCSIGYARASTWIAASATAASDAARSCDASAC
jgi:CheY-like chemotaxis protein